MVFQVRELASSTLSGYIHCGLIAVDKTLLRKLAKLRSSQLTSKSSNSVSSSDGSSSSYNAALIERHAGVLGLKACVKAYPYSIPQWLPSVLMSLADHAYDPTPVEVCLLGYVKKHVSIFQNEVGVVTEIAKVIEKFMRKNFQASCF